VTSPKPLRVEVYRRKDGRWAFRVVGANGQIVADDGNQGFERRIDAVTTASKLGQVTVLEDEL
jgi:hypothetical protein